MTANENQNNLDTITLETVKATFRDSRPLFFALGEETRQDIILMLAEQDALSVQQITARLSLSRPAISHHLKVLREAGLVEVERKGTERFYSLTIDDATRLLKQFLIQVSASCG